MYSAKAHRSAGFTLIEVLVALVIAGLAMTAIVEVFGNGLVAHETASSAETALALAEEKLTLASVAAPLRPGSDKGIFAGRFSWQTTISRFADGDDAKRPIQPDGNPLLYRIVVAVEWRDGRRGRQVTLSTLHLGTATP
jgi:general secretion pathway protein I